MKNTFVCHLFLKCLLLCFIFNAVRSSLSFKVRTLTAFIKIELGQGPK